MLFQADCSTIVSNFQVASSVASIIGCVVAIIGIGFAYRNWRRDVDKRRTDVEYQIYIYIHIATPVKELTPKL